MRGQAYNTIGSSTNNKTTNRSDEPPNPRQKDKTSKKIYFVTMHRELLSIEEEEDMNDSVASVDSRASHSSSSRSSNSSSSNSKSVSFSPELSVHIHSLVVGDSPSCPLLPLQLDWCYDQETLDLDQYESSPSTRRRRFRGPKKLLFYERSERLEDVAGYSPKELMEIKREAEKRIKEEERAAAEAANLTYMDGDD